MPGTPEVLTDTTIFVCTVGDKVNFSDCVDHLLNQTVSAPIEIIDRVAPMSAAFHEMHLRCRTEFYIQVDEDMLLFPHAVRALRTSIGSAPKNIALSCAPLWDCDAERTIYGVKIYRFSIVKQFPYRNTASCESSSSPGFELPVMKLCYSRSILPTALVSMANIIPRRRFSSAGSDAFRSSACLEEWTGLNPTAHTLIVTSRPARFCTSMPF